MNLTSITHSKGTQVQMATYCRHHFIQCFRKGKKKKKPLRDRKQVSGYRRVGRGERGCLPRAKKDHAENTALQLN